MRSRSGGGGPRALTLAIVAAVCLALPAAASAGISEIASMQAATGIDCASASTCYVVGADQNDAPAVLTVTNGNPGAVSEFSDPNFEPAAIACPDAGHCIAVGDDLDPSSGEQVGAVAPVTGGTPGDVQEVAGAAALVAVGCGGDAYCIAAGTDQSGNAGTVQLTAAGQAQALADVPGTQPFQAQAVACPGSTTCTVAGGTGSPASGSGAISVVSGGNPAAPVTASAAAQLTGIACFSGGHCVTSGVAGNGVDSFGNPIPEPSVTGVSGAAFGATWEYSGYSPGGMAAVACGSGSVCLAIGDDDSGDEFSVPIQSGQAGTAQAIPADPAAGGAILNALACPSASSCLAIGQDASDAPVLADLAVPAYQATAPAVPAPPGSGSGSGSGTGSGPGSGHGPPRSGGHRGAHRRPTRLLIAVTWPATQPVPGLTVTVRCQNAVTLRPISRVRVRLQARSATGRWHTIGSALTRRLGAARFHVPARVGTRIAYRAVFAGTRAYAGSDSAVKRVSVVG